MSFFQNDFGAGFQLSDHLVFFGAKNFSEVAFANQFPHFRPCRIRQTHSDIVIEASETVKEADSQFASTKDLALVVATADCIPLMIHCQQTSRVAAVHAGWRGVENQIVAKTIAKLEATGSSALDFHFYIGPHIRQDSFETESDVFEALKLAHPNVEPSLFSYSENQKYYISLCKLIRFQIEGIMAKSAEISDVSIDTKMDNAFHSYRRDKSASGRNLNFIVRL